MPCIATQVVEHWTFSLFFCIAELWGSVVISVLFWTLANDVCTVADAKTIYPLMGIAANIALVVAGNYMKWVNRSLTGGSLAVSLQVLVMPSPRHILLVKSSFEGGANRNVGLLLSSGPMCIRWCELFAMHRCM